MLIEIQNLWSDRGEGEVAEKRNKINKVNKMLWLISVGVYSVMGATKMTFHPC